MNNGLPLRRSQLVTTFGPGSLVVSPSGDTTIIGALDKWFYDLYMNKASSTSEFEVQEPRLKSLLKVGKLLLPPDYRPGYRFKNDGVTGMQQNSDLIVPLLRFPTWHICPKCKTLHQTSMTDRSNYIDCKECRERRVMVQVSFIIACSEGHIADFPWREWAHSNENTSCGGNLKLISSGGATLDSMKVKCSSCSSERSLKGIMTRNLDGEDNGITVLGRTLNKEQGKYYSCPGHRPWLGSENDKEPCSAYPIAVLKNAANVYTPRTISAIYLPGENQRVDELIKIFQARGITASSLMLQESMENKVKFVKMNCPPSIEEYAQSDIEIAIAYMGSSEELPDNTEGQEKWVERELRRKEFEILIKELDSAELKIINELDQPKFIPGNISTVFSKINRVTRLKETIVLTGFGRLETGSTALGLQQVRNGRKMMFKHPELSENNWLPAFCVYGEGIFFTINLDLLKAWEQQPKLQQYFNRMLRRVSGNPSHNNDDIFSASYVLLHTLAHLIIDQLAITCGYNSTSLRERLYLEENQAGILIYTSSGDIEGTFGGLVRMGKPKEFLPVVEKALEAADWCSSDPVCTEIGSTEGQGLQQLNGAACHSCTYLPETSCELGNLFLDRSLLINKDFGFFAMLNTFTI